MSGLLVRFLTACEEALSGYAFAVLQPLANARRTIEAYVAGIEGQVESGYTWTYPVPRGRAVGRRVNVALRLWYHDAQVRGLELGEFAVSEADQLEKFFKAELLRKGKVITK